MTKLAPVAFGFGVLLRDHGVGAPVDGKLIERDVAPEDVADRSEHDVGERHDDAREGQTEHERDRQVDQVASVDELPELLEHR